jgi:hypothetical protein
MKVEGNGVVIHPTKEELKKHKEFLDKFIYSNR